MNESWITEKSDVNGTGWKRSEKEDDKGKKGCETERLLNRNVVKQNGCETERL